LENKLLNISVYGLINGSLAISSGNKIKFVLIQNYINDLPHQ